MRLTVFPVIILLMSCSAPAALVGWWKQDELGGNIVDSTGNNPEATPLGSPIYGAVGVANGLYGSIVVNNAGGTSISYGPSTVDAYFITGSDNNNPVMNIDQTAQLTVMGWLRPATPELPASHTYRMVGTGSSVGGEFGWGLGLRLTITNGVIAPFARFTAYGVVDKDVAIPPSSVVERMLLRLAGSSYLRSRERLPRSVVSRSA